MDAFKFTKLAAESGKESLIAVAIFLIVAVLVIYRFSEKPEGLASKQGLIVLAVLLVGGVIILKNVYTRFQSSEAWEVTVDDQSLIWVSPKGLGNSFDVRLKDIKKLNIVSDDDDNFHRYELILDGSSISLHDELGMDFDAFIDALKARGVEVETEVLAAE